MRRLPESLRNWSAYEPGSGDRSDYNGSGVEDSPAMKAGFQDNDILYKVEGEEVTGKDLSRGCF